MEIATLPAQRRTALGRNALRKLRADGHIPAVIYGGGKDNVSLSLDGEAFERLHRTHHRIFRLELGAGSVEEAFLQDVSIDAIDDAVVHIDFKRVRLDQPIQAEVALEFVGHPVGLAKEGRFDHVLTSLKVECLPADLPESIEVEVKNLDVGQNINASQVTLPKGVKLITAPEATVCLVKHVKEEVVEAAPAEGAEAVQPELIRKPKEGEEGAAAPAAGAA